MFLILLLQYNNGNINAEGTSAKLSFVGYYTAIGSNVSTASFAYKLASASTFTALTNSATGSGGSINGSIITSTFAIANEYDFKISLKDSLGSTVERTVRLNSVARTLNVAKYGNGVAVGKMSTVSTNVAAGKFECGWDASFDKSVSIDGILNANKNIYMGGSKGQTSGLSIVFSNPDSSENPHNSYIYGGNPAAQTAIGCWDNKNGRNIWSYNDSSNTFAIGSSDATISIKGAALSDFVVQQGTSGNWYYRKWNSGRAECWGNIPINTAITGSIGSIYYAAIENIAFPSGLFINKPLVFANSTSTAVLTVAIRGSTTTKSVFGINLMYPVSYPNAITWEVAVEARGTWK